MSTILAGLSKEEFNSYWGSQPNLSKEFNWQDTNYFISHITQNLAENPNSLGIWLYHNPWTFLQTKVEQEEPNLLLELWYQHQQSILKLKRTLGERLVLINVNYTSATELAHKLNLPESLIPSTNNSESTKEYHELLIALFQHTAKKYWDLLKTLDSAALESKDPTRNHKPLPPLSKTNLFSLVRLVQQSDHLLILEKQNQNFQNQLQQAQNELKDQQRSNEQLIKSHAATLIQQEKKLQSLQDELLKAQQTITQTIKKQTELEDQKQQLQSQLKNQQLSNEQLTKTHTDTLTQKENILKNTQQELEQSKHNLLQLENELSKSKTSEQDLEEKLRNTDTENELLITQLHQTQEELERYYLDNKKSSTHLQAIQFEIEQYKNQITEHRAQLKEAQQQTECQTRENELLLAQLHHTQEELEHYYLENKKLNSSLNKTQENLSQAQEQIKLDQYSLTAKNQLLETLLKQTQTELSQQKSQFSELSQKSEHSEILFKAKLEDYQSTNTLLIQYLNETQQTLSQASSVILRLQKTLNQQHIQNTQQAQQLEHNAQEVTQLTTELQQYRQSNTYMLDQFKDTQQTLTQACAITLHLQKQLKQKQNHIHQLEQNILQSNHLQKELEDCKHSNFIMLQQFNDTQKTLQQAFISLIKLKKQADDKQTHITQLELETQKIPQLSQELNQYQKINDVTQSYLKDTQQTLNQARIVILTLQKQVSQHKNNSSITAQELENINKTGQVTQIRSDPSLNQSIIRNS